MKISLGLLILAAAGSAQAAPVAFTVVEAPAEVRIETPAYALAVTREGFGWTLSRGGTTVLKSAPPNGAAPNGIMLIEGKPERATTLKTVEKQADRVVLE